LRWMALQDHGPEPAQHPSLSLFLTLLSLAFSPPLFPSLQFSSVSSLSFDPFFLSIPSPFLSLSLSVHSLASSLSLSHSFSLSLSVFAPTCSLTRDTLYSRSCADC